MGWKRVLVFCWYKVMFPSMLQSLEGCSKEFVSRYCIPTVFFLVFKLCIQLFCMRVIIRVNILWLSVREKIQSSMLVEASGQTFVLCFEAQN